MNESAFGEAVFGRTIGAELRARGDRVLFVAPSAHAPLLDGIEHVELSPDDPQLDRRMIELVRRVHPASVILFDATSILIALEQRGISPRFLQTLDCRVIAHDCWNLPRTGLRIDMGPGFWPIPPLALGFGERLLPVPACPLRESAGAYDALPRLPKISRRTARRATGIGSGERLVLMATARFQEPDLHAFEPIARWARALPELLADYLAGLPKTTRVVHVGPRAWPALRRRLGDRYQRRAPGPFDARLLSAADVFLSFNLTASTVASAIAARVPVVMGTCSRPAAAKRRAASPRVARWLDKHAPLHPFYLWPCGFHAFLAPLLRQNPYREAIETVEVLDEAAFVGTLERLLAGGADADAIRDRQARYEARVRRLPSGADVVEQWLRR